MNEKKTVVITTNNQDLKTQKHFQRLKQCGDFVI